MAKDQVHEKNNKIIKRLGGATSLLNTQDESALIMWETCGLEVPRIVAKSSKILYMIKMLLIGQPSIMRVTQNSDGNSRKM